MIREDNYYTFLIRIWGVWTVRLQFCRMRRHELKEQKYILIKPYTRGYLNWGRDNRLFVNTVLYRVCTDISWRDPPERFGP